MYVYPLCPSPLASDVGDSLCVKDSIINKIQIINAEQEFRSVNFNSDVLLDDDVSNYRGPGGLRDEMDRRGMNNIDSDYETVSIIGSQSSGKST